MAFKMKNPSLAKLAKNVSKGSATMFNAKLKKASAEGKLSGKFKEAVDASPAKMKKAAMKMKKESMAMMKKSVAMMKKASAMKMKMEKSAAKLKKASATKLKKKSAAKLDTKALKKEGRAILAGAKGFATGSARSISRGISKAKSEYKRSKAKK